MYTFTKLIFATRIITISLMLFTGTRAYPSFTKYIFVYPNVKWISLVYDDYSEEREKIIDFYKKTFDTIWVVKNKTPEEVPIAIGLYDFDHDGVNEIIAFISDTEFCGAKDSGGLHVLSYDGEDIINSRGIAGFPLETRTLNDPESRQIGIIRNRKGWDYLYVNGRVWKTTIPP